MAANTLKWQRKKFNGSEINDSQISASVLHLATAANHESFENKNRYFSDRSDWLQESIQLRSKFSPADIYSLRIKLKREFSTLPDFEIEQAVDDELRKLQQLRL